MFVHTNQLEYNGTYLFANSSFIESYKRGLSQENQVHSDIKSEALRLLNKEDVVLLDAGNYIKAWEFNQQRAGADVLDDRVDNSNVPYTREIFDALCMRYEEPHGNCRWDSPLFVVFP
ncbi:PREDICTED: protein KTI12 homolog [Rhagoletis zephyria]|uniref:protein KTI12 homolog n=1 Tax=Rhagoletis zephyria TaxID=28612 RepID=UPI0008112A32|nr:PREDICTED: protein KTI12 homolog [Rhagoletis zephyria]